MHLIIIACDINDAALPSIIYTNIDRDLVYFDQNFKPFLHLQTEVIFTV